MPDGAFDPFSRPAFYPDPEVTATAGPLADAAVDVARREFAVALDGTPDSLRAVDDILDRLREEQAAGTLLAGVRGRYAERFGAYLGEVVRRSIGGTWGVGRFYSETAPALRAGTPPGTTVDVVVGARVLNRIRRADAEGLWAFHQALARSLADPGAAAAAAADVLRPRGKYALRHDNGYFDAGTASGGRQAMMVAFYTGLTAIFFDADGELLGHEVRPLPPEEPADSPARRITLDTPAVEAALAAWKAEVGFRPEPIRVQRFEVDELGVGIADRPSHMEEFLKAPEVAEPNETEREHSWQSLREWEAEGNFVLYWGNDLWVNAEGEVTSS